MKVRRYVAPDMRRALAMVRQAQGPEVMILSNRPVDGGVELITADDEGAAPGSDAADAALPEGRHGATAPGKDLPQAGAYAEALWTREPVMEAMRTELRSLRRLVESQIAGLAWGDLGRRHPLRAGMLRRLVTLGFAPRVAQDLVAEVPETLREHDAWHRTLAVVARRLRVAGEVLGGRGGVYALVGPTGVGKTTLIAKLAARQVLAGGADSVALITTDARRIGAHEQLRSFGRILGVPVWVAGDAQELRRALDAALDRRLVLVDTAGAGGCERDLGELGAMLGAGAPALRVVLVMAAVTQAGVLEGLLAPYRGLAPWAALLTKLDESNALGAALGTAIAAELPIAGISAGQRIPEDLEAVSAAALVARAVQMARQGGAGADDVLLEAAFTDEVEDAMH